MEYTEPDKPRKIYRKPAPKPTPPASKVIQWFASRGISEKTLTEAGITEAKEWMPQVGGERSCICFPYFRGGELINIKYRDGEKNFKLEKDAELIFFGLDTIKEGSELAIITEGEIDALTLMESGVRSSILSVPNGASKGSQRLEYLDNCWQHLEAIKEIIIATDGDLPGLTLRDELARRLGPERCFFIEYPEGSKDLNEILLKSGKVGVLEAVKHAKPFPLEGIETANDLYPGVLDIMQNGYPDGLRSGWEEFDTLLRFDETGFTVITGIPGHGKSTWLNNLLVRMAKRHAWRIGMLSPEMQPSRLLMAQLVELCLGKGIRAGVTIDELNRTMAWLDGQFWVMKIDEMDLTIDGILEKAVQLVKFYGINALVIDPWNYIEHKVGDQSETLYISEALTKIKRFKDRYKVHVFLVAHPTKIKRTDAGLFLVPTLYDIAGSANFKNKMDNGIVVYRNPSTGATEIHVLKVRWFFLGEQGMCNMFYDSRTRIFSDHAPPSTSAGTPEGYFDEN
jgi:twinkle protein